MYGFFTFNRANICRHRPGLIGWHLVAWHYYFGRARRKSHNSIRVNTRTLWNTLIQILLPGGRSTVMGRPQHTPTHAAHHLTMMEFRGWVSNESLMLMAWIIRNWFLPRLKVTGIQDSHFWALHQHSNLILVRGCKEHRKYVFVRACGGMLGFVCSLGKT